MNKNNTGKRRSADENSGYRWTNTEQKRLEALINDGYLSVTDTSSKVKEVDEIFENYSNNVIGYHLGLLRKKKLSPTGRLKARSSTGPVNDALSQFGVVSVSPPTSRSESAPCDVIDIKGSDSLLCDNMPFLRFTYMDYESKQEKVVILLDLPGGSGNYEWDFNDIGDSITLHVDWSKTLCDVANLFQADLKAKRVTLDHPKLHSMQSKLLRKGICSKQVPKCCIQVSLGKRVHKDDGTWDADIVQNDGNKILRIEFSCFQEEVLKKVKCGSFKNE